MTRRRLRRLGNVLVVVGVVAIAYAAAVVLWRDPVTDLYARWKQHQLSEALERSFEAYRAQPIQIPSADAPGSVSQPATAPRLRPLRQVVLDWQKGLEPGDPLGRIIIPKLDIHPVFVNGTRWGPDLTRGPGQYERTALPGLGRVTAIAGHRTTFGAPFRHIDRLEPGDVITLEMPYGTFRYIVFSHKIVKSDDWSIIRERGFETLVLSACHPLYSSSQRWIVFARLARVERADAPSPATTVERDAVASSKR